jgi:hypothetical protein
MHDGAAQVVLRTPKVADFHVIDEMARVHRRDMSRLGSIFGFRSLMTAATARGLRKISA